jgi:hypothetical protein
MSRNARVTATVVVALLALLLLGAWVGAFETFGGYVFRQRTFLWVSLGIGLGVALLLNRRWKVRLILAGAFFLLSHLVYILGQAVGQTYNVGVTGVGDFVRTLWLALNGQL